MSSISQTGPDGQSQLYAYAVKAVASTLGAGFSVIPIFPLLMRKTAQQVGDPLPSAATGLKEGCKAAPTVAVIVGSQMIAQSVFERVLKKMCGTEENGSASFAQMIMSATIVGALTAPALAAFNGQTMGKGVMESIRTLNRTQVAAITGRETFFVGTTRMSEPVSEYMQNHYGNHPAVKTAALFATGAAGTFVVHPLDTVLSLAQRNMQVESARHLMRGSLAKSGGMGLFFVLYNQISQRIESLAE